ncbi:MAG TPA: hypothetical protein VMI13_10750 [Solirubrobacteraceae bacterium]|nr:hypothetical protein [Solirubrobacteraceae bacterium]
MRNALIEEVAQQRAADLTRAAQNGRVARGGLDARRDGLISLVSTLLVRRRAGARRDHDQELGADRACP